MEANFRLAIWEEHALSPMTITNAFRAFRSPAACAALTAILTLSSGTTALAAAAASSATDTSGAVSVEEVVVTGSHIVGTPENTALPVTVLTDASLQKQGTPSVVELIKQLPESSGVIGESNQFTGGGRGQGAYGQSTINLRGLGPERTLVLFNGHRLPLAGAFAVDANKIPISAIGRVEVLKDGAAAIYGSDAIGGVVNFITKTNVRGLDLSADYRHIGGAKGGDYTVNATWGTVFERGNFLISGGFQHRSELPVLGKNWAHLTYDENPEGGFTGGGNPERFIPAADLGSGLVKIGGSRLDLGCVPLGGQLTGANANPAPLLPWNSCRGQFSVWDNLEEETNSFQVYSEVNYKLGGSHKLHLEAAYGYTNIPFFKSSPSYVTTRTVPITVEPGVSPTSGFVATGTSPLAYLAYYVPIANPGFAAYIAANPGQFPAGTQGAFLPVGSFRPFLQGGNPFYNYKHGVGGRYTHSQINLSASLKGDVIPAVHYEASLTYGAYRYFAEGRDTLTDRLELALRGLGGPGCDYTKGTPGVGPCQWLNPFSNAIPGNPTKNTTNPGFVPALANSAALADWLLPIQTANSKSEDFEGDLAFNGKLPISLWGGPIGWAAGGQWRHNHYVTEYSKFANSLLAPCADSALPGGSNICVPATGANVFGPISNPVNISQNIFAGYAELSLPVTNSLNIDVAARYEDYGANGGSTFNPQARAKFQLVKFFALRGSVGTTFRAPPQGFLIPDPQTSLQNVAGTFIPVSAIGNPLLKPETALTWSVGGIFDAGNFRATVDYWSYDFKKILTSEPLTPIVSALDCTKTDPASLAFIASHFSFSTPTCDATKIVAVNLLRINGPSVKTDGIDFNVSYRIDDVGKGQLIIGALASHVNHYTVSSFTVPGATIPGFEASGKFNSGQIAYPIPKWKGQFFINYELPGRFNFRGTTRFTSSYVDQRAALFAKNGIYVTPTNPTGVVGRGQTISGVVIEDVAIRLPLKHELVLNLTVNNVFDANPPFARTEINYDALTGDPLGRTVKVGFSKKF